MGDDTVTIQELYNLLGLELTENNVDPAMPVILRVAGVEAEVWDCWYRNIKYYKGGAWPYNTFVIEDES